MPRSKVKKLSSLFRFAFKSAALVVAKPSSAANAVGAANSVGAAVKIHVSSSFSNSTKLRSSVKSSLRKRGNDGPVGDMIHQSLHEDSSSRSDDSAKQISHEISSILGGGTIWESDDDSSELELADDDNLENGSDSSWFSNLFNSGMSLRRKELCRERKNKWIFKNTQKNRFDKLVSMCLEKLGSGSTFQVLFKLGRETGLKEYNAFIKGCIETARSSKDEKVQVEQILEIYRLFQLMKERGFPIEEETFAPFLLYLIDMHLTDQFFLFLEIVKDEDPCLQPRLGYYEMLLWIEINNEEKIQELCDHIAPGESEMGSLLHENYLLALCERDRGKELRQLLEIMDITQVSSLDNVACIFRSLGRLSLQSFADLFIQVLKDCDHGALIISNLIYYYATSMKNLAVEDVIMKFKEMHRKLDVEFLPGSYEKLITFCCDSFKVHLALDIVDEMCEAGLPLLTETLNSICRACEDASEFILVRRIHSMLHQHNLMANNETFRSIINLNVRMKDFDSAYAMLKDLKIFKLMPTASMYNAIIAGFYREKNMNGVLRVLQEMKDADVKPDSQTFSFLISNCADETEITKIVLDKGVPVKSLTEIKSVLISTLASHGQISDALNVYMEIKQSGGSVKPKAIISLIEHLHPEGELSVLLQLMEEVNDPYYWIDGCCRVILYCVRNKDLRSAVDLLKKLAERFQDDELAREVIFDEVFSQIADMEPPDLEIGIGLLQAVKEDLNLCPPRKCLDFLLSACVSAKDLQKSQLVWKEYSIAGLPYNILSYLRMYQAYLASGHLKAANSFIKNIPKGDPHVRHVIHACGVTYGKPKDKAKKKKKKR